MRVQVSLRAEKLDNIAQGRWRGKKSNPYAAATTVSSGDGSLSASAVGTVEVGKTEVIHNNLNPKWTEIFLLEHDESQSWTPLKITLYDSRSPATDKETDDFNRQNTSSLLIRMNSIRSPSLYKSSDPIMGEVDVEVGEILGMEGQELKLDLSQGGCLYVHITESIESHNQTRGGEHTTGTFHCHLRGLDLENIESGILGLGAIDPYFELSKKYIHPSSGIQRWNCVYRSEHIPNIINPYWRPFAIDLEKLCHGNLGKELKIAVWDQQNGAARNADRWLGECEVTVEWLMKCLTKGGNASREDALCVRDSKQEEIGLIVVLKAEIL